MKPGKVEKHINSWIEREPILSALFDPLDWPSPEAAVKAAKKAEEGGAGIIAIGGSMGAQGELLDNVARGIKEETDLPIVLFPGNIATITKHADAVFFMSLLNSRNPYWISQAQTLAAPIVRQNKIEALPVGYIVVEPGGTVGWVGDANLVPRNRPKIAAALALAGQYMGSRIIITDVGSAPATGPVPIDMVEAVRKAIEVPYLVAGGVRTTEQARDIARAGADGIQVGTAFENSKDVGQSVKAMVKALREGKR